MRTKKVYSNVKYYDAVIIYLDFCRNKVRLNSILAGTWNVRKVIHLKVHLTLLWTSFRERSNRFPQYEWLRSESAQVTYLSMHGMYSDVNQLRWSMPLLSMLEAYASNQYNRHECWHGVKLFMSIDMIEQSDFTLIRLYVASRSSYSHGWDVLTCSTIWLRNFRMETNLFGFIGMNRR